MRPAERLVDGLDRPAHPFCNPAEGRKRLRDVRLGHPEAGIGDLEHIAARFKGVEAVHAAQAGRELRILVDEKAVSEEIQLERSVRGLKRHYDETVRQRKAVNTRVDAGPTVTR